MAYLAEFKVHLDNRDLPRFLQLWEEYCSSDSVDSEEFTQILTTLKGSDLAAAMGKYIETALPLWTSVNDKKASADVLRLIFDLQTTHNELLAETALKYIQENFPEDKHHGEKLRLVGLRQKKSFKGAIRNYELLSHMAEGKFVFHTGGWGTGEIMSLSLLREQLVIEFENIGGRKDVSFVNAFNTLIPLPDDHFLARRFADPDKLEQEAKEDPVGVMRMLLRDLGPKTAGEIKDELCELVIPEDEWAKWWQATRAKVKKDTMIASPESLKEPFCLRKEAVSHEERFTTQIKSKVHFDDILQTGYNVVRDFPDVVKDEAFVSALKEKLSPFLADKRLSEAQELQAIMLLEMLPNSKAISQDLSGRILKASDPRQIIEDIDIQAFKKRALVEIRSTRNDWVDIFLNALFFLQQAPLRDYILKELLGESTAAAKFTKKLEELQAHPRKNPDLAVWYFQKAMGSDSIPLSNSQGRRHLFESFLTLFAQIEAEPEYRDLIKKMYTMLSGKRYALVRELLEGSSITEAKEYLLLVSKCQTLTDHDKKIFRSLVEVVHPSLNSKERSPENEHVIWTTEKGYILTQDKIRHLSTIEIVENAREIEAARALGDLRENSEYKFALERRSRLQAELKQLSDMFNRARIITPQDISNDEVGVGSIVNVIDGKGSAVTYTILGPWDANPDAGILSFQSKLAQAMTGCHSGDTFQFKNEDYKVVSIKSYLEG